MGGRFTGFAVFWTLVATLLVSERSFAQAGDVKARARTLLAEGKALIAAARYDEGCPKFAESQKLDPSAEALVSLAHCLELQGKVATAWMRYGQVRHLPPAARKPELERRAAEHLRALEPRIPRLEIVMPSASPPDELRLNGDVFGSDAWSSPLPLDPGVYEIEASAPGKRMFRVRLDIAEGELRRLEIPPLEPASSAVAGTNVSPPVTGPATTAPRPSTQSAGRWNQQKTAFLLGATGALSLGIGGYFGLQAISKRSESDPLCPTDNTCHPRGTELNEEAKTAARISDIGFGVGLASIGVATYLWLTADSAETSRVGNVPIRIAAGPQAISIATGGAW